MANDKKEKDLISLLLLGAGIGGYFLWKYLKEEPIPPPINPTGFVIIERYCMQEEKKVDFPIPKKEFDVIITGMNASRTETIDGYCNIISDEEIVFNETINNVEPRKAHFFKYTTLMPETTLNLIVETGRIVNAEKIIDHSIPLEIIPKIRYCFMVYNLEEEIQMNDFLGIDPPGVDINTYLSRLTRPQIDEWKNYWVAIWTNLNRSDIVNFVKTMYDKYYKKI